MARSPAPGRTWPKGPVASSNLVWALGKFPLSRSAFPDANIEKPSRVEPMAGHRSKASTE